MRLAGCLCAALLTAATASALPGSPHAQPPAAVAAAEPTASPAPLVAEARAPVAGASVAAAPAGRPRIGLALGGGSAKGLAHIGILRWFEEHRIPIDVVSGTSMGGLVGGAYATGMSPAELAALMKNADWDLMFLSDSPFKYKTFRRKQDKRAYPSQLEFGLKGGLSMPAGLNPGQQVALMLDRIALPYYDLDSFDDLPTPFRCVATDLKTAEIVVLSKGRLATAMRATMSIPALFAPVADDNRLLVDGGTLNNIPADVTRSMGADVVIAVDVSAETDLEKDAKQTIFSTLGKTITTMMDAGTKRALASADIIIDPDLTGLGSTSWRESEELAARGYKAAQKMGDRLLKYSVSDEEYRALAAARQARRRTKVPIPTAVEVVGVPPNEQAFIRAMLAENIGKPLDPERIARGILRVDGTDRYEYLTYRLASGPSRLVITARAKGYGPPFLAIGAELSNVDSSNFAVNLSGRVTMYDVTGRGSEARLDAGVGTRQRFAAELFQPIGGSRVFVAPHVSYDRAPRNSYVDDRLVGEYRQQRAGAGLGLGVNASRNAEVRVGYDIADVKGTLRVGSPDLPAAKGAERYASAQFVYDGQNSPIVPSRGLFATGSIRRYFSAPSVTGGAETFSAVDNPQDYWQGEVSGSWFKRLHGQDRVFARLGAGTSFGDIPLFNRFSLGGPLRMSAFHNDELRGANYAFACGGYLLGISRLPDVIGGNVYVGSWLEAGSAFDRRDAADWRGDAAVAVIMETLVGPVFAGASVGFDGHSRFYIGLGPLFR
jgi:NTE family protein